MLGILSCWFQNVGCPIIYYLYYLLCWVSYYLPSTLKPKELKAVRKAAKEMLNWSDKEVDKLVEQDVLQEINDG